MRCSPDKTLAVLVPFNNIVAQQFDNASNVKQNGVRHEGRPPQPHAVLWARSTVSDVLWAKSTASERSAILRIPKARIIHGRHHHLRLHSSSQGFATGGTFFGIALNSTASDATTVAAISQTRHSAKWLAWSAAVSALSLTITLILQYH